MDTQEQGRGTGTQSTSARPFVGAAVNYIGTSADSLVRARRYAAVITALSDEDNRAVSLSIFSPNGSLLTLPSIRFSPAPDPGCWTWPAAG